MRSTSIHFSQVLFGKPMPAFPKHAQRNPISANRIGLPQAWRYCLWIRSLTADNDRLRRVLPLKIDRHFATWPDQVRLDDLQHEARGRRGIEGIASALVIQWVVATAPNVPHISGQVVKSNDISD